MLFNADARPKGKHLGRYNSPALSEVGIIFNDEHPDVVHHDVIVYFRDKPEYRKDGKEDATQTFNSENAFYDPLRKNTHNVLTYEKHECRAMVRLGHRHSLMRSRLGTGTVEFRNKPSPKFS